jgi:hypothetical protein
MLRLKWDRDDEDSESGKTPGDEHDRLHQL